MKFFIIHWHDGRMEITGDSERETNIFAHAFIKGYLKERERDMFSLNPSYGELLDIWHDKQRVELEDVTIFTVNAVKFS